MPHKTSKSTNKRVIFTATKKAPKLSQKMKEARFQVAREHNKLIDNIRVARKGKTQGGRKTLGPTRSRANRPRE